ncbi:MAG: SufE family protein [Pseudomonadota bacterium]
MTTIEELQDNFALFEDWEERYSYLIDLGRHLPDMDDALKTEETLVKGCTSRVWMICKTQDDGRMIFIADSDAHIVRGLIALVLAGYNNKTPQEITDFDIEDVFGSIGLDQHLSPNRRNGFFAMVERVRALASS